MTDNETRERLLLTHDRCRSCTHVHDDLGARHIIIIGAACRHSQRYETRAGACAWFNVHALARESFYAHSNRATPNWNIACSVAMVDHCPLYQRKDGGV